jgi:hypothetical protein
MAGRGVQYVRTHAFSRGVLGGQRGWTAIFAVVTIGRFVGKYIGRDPQYLTTERLKIGQSMTVTAVAPPLSRRKRRKARRRAAAGR